MKQKGFGVVCDIDGVVSKGGKLINGSKSALELLVAKDVPFIFVTNGGGYREQVKANKLSKNLGFEIPVERVILSHSPFRLVGKNFLSKKVLVVGVEEEESMKVMRDYGFENFVFHEKYLDERPHMLNFFSSLRVVKNMTAKRVVPVEMVLEEDPFDAIFVRIQICVDVLAGNGKVGEIANHKCKIPIFLANPDLEYFGRFATPRLTAGAFGTCIKAIYKEKTGYDLDTLEYCGKPYVYPYKFAEEILKEQSRFYMIGDNPLSDIRGANPLSNWKTVLVKTGCFMGEGNDKDNPADFVVEDLREAINLILEEEKEI